MNVGAETVGAERGRASEAAGEPESKRSLWRALRGIFEGHEAGASLRTQLEEVIDGHESEEDNATQVKGDLSGLEREMLRNLLHFGEREAGDVAIPRGQIIALPEKASWDEVVAAFAEHGHSRLPVYAESLDEITGMMLIKDVFPHLATGQPPADWRVLARQPLFVPQARRALDVLADMRSSRVHLAVVVDEYSGTDGIITFEDLVEEIIGEIEDEHDDAPEELLCPLENGVWEADARALLEDVASRVDPRLAEVEEAVDTLGGLAFVLAEHVPPVGALLHHASGWSIEIIAGDERHVTRLRLHPPNTHTPATHPPATHTQVVPHPDGVSAKAAGPA